MSYFLKDRLLLDLSPCIKREGGREREIEIKNENKKKVKEKKGRKKRDEEMKKKRRNKKCIRRKEIGRSNE